MPDSNHKQTQATNEPETTLRNMRFKTAIMRKVEKLAAAENRSFNNMVETILMRVVGGNDSRDEEYFKAYGFTDFDLRLMDVCGRIALLTYSAKDEQLTTLNEASAKIHSLMPKHNLEP